MVKSTLSRISGIVRSNVHDLLDHLEDPERMVRQMVRDMEAEVDRVVSATGAAVAGQRRLEKDQEEHRERSRRLECRARQALDAGDEELARQVLARKVLSDQAADDIEPALEEGRRTASQLRGQLVTLRQELEEARNRQAALIARIRASRQVGFRRDDLDGDPAAEFDRLGQRLEHNRSEFDRMRQRLELAEVAGEASAEARRTLLGEDGVLGRRFEELEMRRRVDEELAALRPREKQDEEGSR